MEDKSTYGLRKMGPIWDGGIFENDSEGSPGNLGFDGVWLIGSWVLLGKSWSR